MDHEATDLDAFWAAWLAEQYPPESGEQKVFAGDEPRETGNSVGAFSGVFIDYRVNLDELKWIAYRYLEEVFGLLRWMADGNCDSSDEYCKREYERQYFAIRKTLEANEVDTTEFDTYIAKELKEVERCEREYSEYQDRLAWSHDNPDPNPDPVGDGYCAVDGVELTGPAFFDRLREKLEGGNNGST